MSAPNIPAAKRQGLPVDLARLATDGDDWLSPEERYALKTHGVCAQLQEHMFMVRVRVPGGRISTDHARQAARLAGKHAADWLHITTRQNLEIHWVTDLAVPALLDDLDAVGLSTRSACGHTIRNVMASEDAGTGFDEPFDCLPDARLISATLVARSAELNVTLPSRLNIALGGSPRCQDDALVNDIGLVSTVRDGVAGYRLWAGGSLGKAPSLAVELSPFVARDDVLAAVEAIIDVFVAHGAFDDPTKGRLKFLVARLGEEQLRALWGEALESARHRPRATMSPIEVLSEDERQAVLALSPPGGWSVGVRPQRTPGLASLTVDVVLGDVGAADMGLICDLADRHAGGMLTLTRDQNITLHNVALGDVSTVRQGLAGGGLHVLGEGGTADIRACTGSAVCALGITDAPGAGHGLAGRPSLLRNSALRVFVSGCPNSCAQHQIADIGLAGSKVRVAGRTVDGYQVFLGSELDQQRIGEVVGRVAATDLGDAIDAIVGSWEALRHGRESLGSTVRRVGLDSFAAQIGGALERRWASGPEPSLVDPPTTIVDVVSRPSRAA